MKKNGTSLFTGLFMGATAGFLVGLIFAPKSGEETRKDLTNASLKIKNKVENSLEKLKNRDFKKDFENIKSLISEKTQSLSSMRVQKENKLIEAEEK